MIFVFVGIIINWQLIYFWIVNISYAFKCVLFHLILKHEGIVILW